MNQRRTSIYDFFSLRSPARLLLKRSASTIEAAEKREKRVLIQMGILVLAFLVFWLPFWIYMTTMHVCNIAFDEVR